MSVDRNGLERLERGACLRLLAAGGIGRLGLTSGALPVILPIAFALDGDDVIVRTVSGLTVQHAVEGSVIAFEADDFDVDSHAGWSVLVTGRAELVTDEREIVRLGRLGLPVWPGDDQRFVRISTEVMTGRRTAASRQAAGVRSV